MIFFSKNTEITCEKEKIEPTKNMKFDILKILGTELEVDKDMSKLATSNLTTLLVGIKVVLGKPKVGIL